MEIERLRLQYEITNAQLLYEITPAKMNISVKHGQMDIQREPLKLTIDPQSFADATQISADSSQAREQAQKGKTAVDAAGRYSREKNATLNPAQMNSAEIAAAASAQGAAAGQAAGRPKLTWTGGKVTLQAEQDQVSVDWQPQSIEFTYIPYSVEFYIDKW
jgi:hypothetical protein